jgi:simple sugar transport system substrate-binding protein
VREPDVIVEGGDRAPTEEPESRTPREGGLQIAEARIAVITHGQASDPFWAIVRKGIFDAAGQTGVAVSYRAPDTYDLDRMAALIDDSVSDRPDALVVSLPDVDPLQPAIRRARLAGIPVVSINSGSDVFRRLRILAHVGQPERRAGYEGGVRMARAGVRNAVCVNQEVGNEGLDLRCRAFAAGLAASGGRSRTIAVRLQDPGEAQRTIAQAVNEGDTDGVMALGPGGAEPALAALRAARPDHEVKVATFDLSPAVLEAVQDGRMLFAIDQQPYLQGYLPIVLLAEEARHELFPARGELIPTGPHFVTRANAAEAMRLSEAGVR